MVLLWVPMLVFPSKHGYGYPNLLIYPDRGGYRRCPRYRWSPMVILGIQEVSIVLAEPTVMLAGFQVTLLGPTVHPNPGPGTPCPNY